MTLNDRIHFTIVNMFEKKEEKNYSFKFGDHYLVLEYDYNFDSNEYQVNFSLHETVDSENYGGGVNRYFETITKKDAENDLVFLDSWIKECFSILLNLECYDYAKYIVNDEDHLNMIHESFFDEYDNDNYYCSYSEYPDSLGLFGKIKEVPAIPVDVYLNHELDKTFFDLNNICQQDLIRLENLQPNRIRKWVRCSYFLPGVYQIKKY